MSFVTGFRAAMLVAALVAVSAAIASWLLMRPLAPRSPPAETDSPSLRPA
jgi:predicted MFS family arabinose efflux permease